LSFVGIRKGSGKSKVIQKRGPDYFGISMEECEAEIRLYRDDEFHRLVDPVYKDKGGRHFLKFNAPDGGVQRFYLEDNDYFIEGAIDEVIEEDN